jgi:hypothetical protein
VKHHDRKPKKCKYCPRDAKRNVNNYGRNKGHYRTCGSVKCKTAQYRDKAVNAMKICLKEKTCLHCASKFVGTGIRQLWCRTCVPDKNARGRMCRYGVSQPEYETMKAANNGVCPLCKLRPVTDIDHNHSTGKVRGMLCMRCNGVLGNVEDSGWLKRALKYALQK